MKQIRFPRPRRPRRFEEKFSRDAAFFGSEKRPAPQDFGSLRWLIAGAVALAVLVLCVLLIGRIPKVREVTATDGAYYTAAVLLQYADIEVGDEMVGFDSFAVEKKLKKALPLLDTVKVRKHLSGKVSITVTEQEKLYYTRHHFNYYILAADSHEVLQVASADTEARRVGAIYLGLPEATRVRVGETLSFVNLPYASETHRDELTTYEAETAEPNQEYAYVFEFIDALMESPLAARVVGMDVSDRYNISFVLDGRIRVRVGDMSELDRKLTMAARSLEETETVVLPDLCTLVDVSDPARIVHRTSPAVELPDWAK